EIHKQRVLGDCGHLSNFQTADALTRVLEKTEEKPQVVVLCHLSKDHNSPELAKTTIHDFLHGKGFSVPIDVAERNQRTQIYSVG
ncbi:MAG: hypothetical protein Q4F84_03270, partial [Fibrobacter sp.]|nr:hypothetical protein [Fibrobacter sp.]